VYHSSGNYDAAISDYSTAIGLASGVFRATIYNLYAFRGESYRASGRHDKAVLDYTAAIALFPHPAYFYHRGLALKAQGLSDNAAEDFKRSGSGPGPIEWFDKGN
jgi:tetratricopeptide (TPR) repeat protein